MSYASYKNLGNKNEDYGDNKKPPGTTYLITSREEKENFIKNNKLVVVDVYGDWCGPCKQCAPKFDEMAMKYSRQGKCLLVKEDVDKNFSDDVQGVPTFQFYVNGKLDSVITGANVKAVEEKIIELI